MTAHDPSHHLHPLPKLGGARAVIDRRTFLVDLGRRTFAAVILGHVLVACSDDGEDGGDTRPETTRSSTTSAGDDPTSTTASGEPGAEALRWQRVNLDFVSAYVLVRGREAAVVDTGTAGSEAMIGQTLSDLGCGWGDVDHVFLTHFHPDHAGSIGAVLDSAIGATAYAGQADIASIESPRPLTAVDDGGEVFGLQVIATPGHTAGHISILDTDTGLLVAGDALTLDGTELTGSNPQFTADVDQAEASVRKLADLRFDTLLLGHGDPIESGADQQVAALAASL